MARRIRVLRVSLPLALFPACLIDLLPCALLQLFLARKFCLPTRLLSVQYIHDSQCPMCVGYDTTLEARYIMKDDQRTIDEDLSVAPVRVRRWSKAKWEAHLTETVQEDCDDAAGDSDDEES